MAVDVDVAEDDDRCVYVLPRKKRRCRMLVKRGGKSRFCGEHSIYDPENVDRIACPNDGKHSVLKSELYSHLKKCSFRIGDDAWIARDANALTGETKSSAKIDRRPTEEEIEATIDKVWRCYEAVGATVVVAQVSHPVVEKHLEENTEFGPSKRKHLTQISSILGHVEANGVIPDVPTKCMFELGAGKAQLAYWMAKVAPNGSYLLMDRSGARNKWDNKALLENPALEMKRLRCSIEHLNLTKLDFLKGKENMLAVCKHFCGSATDAGIRCLLNAESDGLRIDSALLVPCCHHRSRYEEYGGREFLAQWGMDDLSTFSALRYLASYATNKAEEQRAAAVALKEQQGPGLAAGDEPCDDPVEPRTWRDVYPLTELGRRAKAILELGRADWLRRVGFSTKVIEYVPASVSPENLLILAIRT